MVGRQEVFPALRWHLARQTRDTAGSELSAITDRDAGTPLRSEFGFAAECGTNGDGLRREGMQCRRFGIERGHRRLQRLDHATLDAEQTMEGGVAFERDEHPPQPITGFRCARGEAVDGMYWQTIDPPERPRRDHTNAQAGETARAGSDRERGRQAMSTNEAIEQRHQSTFGLTTAKVGEGDLASGIIDQTGGSGAGDGFERQEHGWSLGWRRGTQSPPTRHLANAPALLVSPLPRRRPVSITEQDVRHLCKLSSLALSDAEVKRMAGELEAIVGYVKQLQAVDTTGIEPIANVAGLVNVTRPDVPGQMLDQRQVLSNAPAKNDVAILVPKAVER